VADTALGKGALETPDGRRYCPPCAAKLGQESTSDAGDVRIVLPERAVAPPVAPVDEDPEVNLVFADEPEPEAESELEPDAWPEPEPEFEPEGEIVVPERPKSKPETVRSAAGPLPPKPQAEPIKKSPSRMRAARRSSGRRPPRSSARRKKRKPPSSEREKPASRRPQKKRQSVAKKRDTSSRTKPARRRIEAGGFGEDSPTSQRTSRRAPASSLPWYFRLSRSQWIGIAAGIAFGVVLIATLAVWASTGPRRQRTRNRPPLRFSGNPLGMMEEARRLFQSGKRREAIEMLEEAKKVALKQGNDRLVQDINRKLYGIRFKTAP
jgi:hypothetical protein